ncbi:CLUMA_CG006699, isoform A [Clunio marinus]|uniref:CLUMA_CG006699, isoform A n=1 Tax=Clunio marinus TaxID=568069 RepID=A0A1J1I414_9DIPT|nr:CLUMA_CG006699, isoform A [Clunio marinus]
MNHVKAGQCTQHVPKFYAQASLLTVSLLFSKPSSCLHSKNPMREPDSDDMNRKKLMLLKHNVKDINCV